MGRKQIILLLLIFSAFGPNLNAATRYDRIFGWCEQGNQTVSVPTQSPSTTKVQRSYPSCTVTVYDQGTTNLSTVYSDSAGSVPLANPFTSDSRGFWFFYAAATAGTSGRFDIQFSGSNITTPYTSADVSAASPPSYTAPYTGSTIRLQAGKNSDVVSVLDFGCDATGATASDTCVVNALAAVKGTFNGTPGQYNNPTARALYFPSGMYKLNNTRDFHMLSAHSGLTIYGDGIYATIINYTNTTADYCVYHDESVDGKLQRLKFRDIGFNGPGSATSAGWMFWKTTSGSSGPEFDGVLATGFLNGYHATGTVGGDTGNFNYLTMRDVTTAIYNDNSQVTPIVLNHPDLCTSTATNARLFDFESSASFGWIINGGYLCTVSNTGTLFYFGASLGGGGTGGNLTVNGSHVELLGTTAVALNDASTDASKFLTMNNVGFGVFNGSSPRNLFTLSTKSMLVFIGGLVGSGGDIGQITLNSHTGAGTSTSTWPPILVMVGTAFDPFNGNIIEQTCNPGCSAIALNSADRPVVRTMGLAQFAASGIVGLRSDRITGPNPTAITTNGVSYTNETAGNTTQTIDKATITNLAIAALTIPTLDSGITLDYIPRMAISGYVAADGGSATLAVWTTAAPIVLTRIEAYAQTAPLTCTTPPKITISDGTNTKTLNFTNAVNNADTGSFTQNYAANTQLQMKLVGGVGCGTQMGLANIVAQYRMQ